MSLRSPPGTPRARPAPRKRRARTRSDRAAPARSPRTSRPTISSRCASSSARSAASISASTSATRWSAACAPGPSAAARRTSPSTASCLRKDPDELDAFLDRVTINVSHLWRHEDQFEVLRTKLLPGAGRAPAPEDLERRLAPTAPRRTRSPRSAARRSRPSRSRSSAPTSTSAWSPAPARAASPPRMPAPRRRRCCSAISTPQPDGGWAAKPELKRMVRFETGDLLRMAVPTARYDVVFCRNTVIYFTEEVRDALHERLVKALVARRLSRRGHLRACRRPARARPHLARTTSSTGRADGRVSPDVPRRGA